MKLSACLGVWQGSYQNTQGSWLRWYDASENWIPTPTEVAEKERSKAERLAAKLPELGGLISYQLPVTSYQLPVTSERAVSNLHILQHFSNHF